MKFFRIIGLTAFFVVAFVFFAPKINMFYFLEKKLDSHAVRINDETLSDNGFTLSAESASVSVEGIETAKIAQIRVTPLLAYNSIVLENIVLANAMKSFLPLGIEKITVSHSIFSPTTLYTSLKGDFGEASGEIYMLDGNLSMRLVPSQKMHQEFGHTLATLKREENGEYVYVKSF